MNITEMMSGNKKDFDAYVISGASENFLGMQDRLVNSSVINASGLTPEDVAIQIYESVQ